MSKSIKDFCNYVFINGSKKGNKCKNPCRGEFCKRHKEGIKEKMKVYRDNHKVLKKQNCKYIFKIGERKDTVCNNKCIGDYCFSHNEKNLALIKEKEEEKKSGIKTIKKPNNEKYIKNLDKDAILKREINFSKNKEVTCKYILKRGERKGECCYNPCKGGRCALHKDYYLEKKKDNNKKTYGKTKESWYSYISEEVKEKIKNGKVIDEKEYIDKRNKIISEVKELRKDINGIDIYLKTSTIEEILQKYFKEYNQILYKKIISYEEKDTKKILECILDEIKRDIRPDDDKLILPYNIYNPKEKNNEKAEILLRSLENKYIRKKNIYSEYIKIDRMIKESRKNIN